MGASAEEDKFQNCENVAKFTAKQTQRTDLKRAECGLEQKDRIIPLPNPLA